MPITEHSYNLQDNLFCNNLDASLKSNEMSRNSNASFESKFHYIVPLQSLSETVDRGDSWRIWSCIRLAYLIRDTIISLSNGSTTEDSNNVPTNNKYLRAFGGRLKRRGRYLTRREGRCWQTIKEEFLSNYESMEN